MDSNGARTFLAIALSMAVIIFWQMYVAKTHPVKSPDVGILDASVEKVSGEREDAHSKETQNNTKPDENIGLTEEKISYEEETVSIGNALFDATLTNRGGRLKNYILKRYTLPHSLDGVNLVDVNNPSLSLLLNNRTYKFSDNDRYEFKEKSSEGVVMEYAHPDGIVIRKEFRIVKDYELSLKISVLNKTDNNFSFKPVINLYDSALKGGLAQKDLDSSIGYYYYPECLVNEVIVDGKDLKKGMISKSQEGKLNWISSTSRYFISAVMPVEQKASLCRMSSDSKYNYTVSLVYPEISSGAGSEATFSYRLYMGPKGYSLLKKMDSELERSVDFGWLAVLCIPLLYLLNFFNSIVGNYGIAIIFLTIIIKLISIPFTQKSMKSMQELQKIKPKIDELQKKYKDDKDKLNEEMMKLYREYGVSPFGGCLPMLLQMPIWFALYRMLSNSVELYQAVFIPGWINDLSSKDPYYILPILLGVGTFLQQKITPSTMDSAQAKVMLYFMPIFLTFIMISLPSGLTLYIFVSSVLSILHQIYMNKTNVKPINQTKDLREEKK